MFRFVTFHLSFLGLIQGPLAHGNLLQLVERLGDVQKTVEGHLSASSKSSCLEPHFRLEERARLDIEPGTSILPKFVVDPKKNVLHVLGDLQKEPRLISIELNSMETKTITLKGLPTGSFSVPSSSVKLIGMNGDQPFFYVYDPEKQSYGIWNVDPIDGKVARSPEVQVFSKEEWGQVVAWDPERRKILQSRNGAVYEIEPETGSTSKLFSARGAKIRNLWAGRGQTLVASSRGDRTSLFLKDAREVSSKAVGDYGPFRSQAHFDPARARFYYWVYDGVRPRALRVVNTDSGEQLEELDLRPALGNRVQSNFGESYPVFFLDSSQKFLVLTNRIENEPGYFLHELVVDGDSKECQEVHNATPSKPSQNKSGLPSTSGSDVSSGR